MATHKVPQDVETDDKLVGFLSLKQFIFVILGLGFGYLMFFFSTKIQIFTGIIWFPPMAICLVLGLYQRKDQPVEVYLASAIRFYLKPHKRKWNQEGYEERVVITAPPKIEKHYTKDFSGEEATNRLGNLSRMMDSRGWASKMVTEWQNPQFATAAAGDRLLQPTDLAIPSGINPQTYAQPVDVMDEASSIVAKDFNAKINQTDTNTRAHAMQVMQQARNTPESTPAPSVSDEGIQAPKFRPAPTMRQKTIAPIPEETVVAATAPEIPSLPPEPTLLTTVETPPKATTPPMEEPKEPVEPQAMVDDDGSVEIKLH